MRVVHVTTSLGLRGGGIARALLPLAGAQTAQGAEVTICALDAPRHEVPPGVELAIGTPRPPSRLARCPEVRRKLLAQPADVIHAHGVWQRPLAYAREAACRARVPLVISPRGMLSPWARSRSRLLKRLAAVLVHPGAFDAASGWHAASELEAEELRALGHRAPVCVAPHGASAQEAEPARARVHYLEAVPELRGQRVLLFYSRFHPKKGVRELIEMFAGLAPRRPDWHLLIVGIPESDRVETLRRLAARAGAGAQVSVVDGSARPAPWGVGELMVLPSHSENFGLVVLEALLAGLPVLTTAATPWSELGTVGAGGCVPLEGFAEALEELTSRSPRELRAAGERGRDWARARFDWGRSAGRLLAFYAELQQAAEGSP